MPDTRFPFSNFQKSIVYLEGQPCPSVEHGFQAAKTLDLDKRTWVIEAKSAAVAKQRGRRVALRPDWDKVKNGIMLGLLRQKFALGTPFGRDLLAFEGPIVEYTTWHDLYWGVCSCPRHEGRGQNQLGLLLTMVRGELLRQVKEETPQGEPAREIS